jgi:hypothetical protein
VVKTKSTSGKQRASINYRSIVPADCVVSIDSESNRCALELKAKNLDVDIASSRNIDLDSLIVHSEILDSEQ